VGEKAAYVLARQFKTIENLAAAKKEDFDSIYEIGPVIAGSVVDYFSQSQTKKLIRELKNAGLNLIQEAQPSKSSLITAKSFVFTGELKNYSRQQAEELVRSLGGNPSSSVSKTTDFVVVGENPGSKYDKAKKLQVKTIGEEEFIAMLEGK
jgi:DNA ligase (NAD+)